MYRVGSTEVGREVLGDIRGSNHKVTIEPLRSPDVVNAGEDRFGPHAKAEDAVLYPEVERVTGAPGATATMRREHVEVERLTAELERIRKDIGAGGM